MFLGERHRTTWRIGNFFCVSLLMNTTQSTLPLQRTFNVKMIISIASHLSAQYASHCSQPLDATVMTQSFPPYRSLFPFLTTVHPALPALFAVIVIIEPTVLKLGMQHDTSHMTLMVCGFTIRTREGLRRKLMTCI
ncbi:uncharacterized protein LOC131679060 [Topomyia yanbarensis]|uniref:uncharacterized protein LOC131679060 n=1 Tax=Topomyia yanbarensis TaxID=2498891 RepID=UPI00273BC7C4|nr:uncharacterized protein LOC131679060 [Topomyia yanbarensis]